MPQPGGGSSAGGEEPRGTEYILLVEDDENVRDVVADMLGELGYHVVSTSDGNEALERLAGDGPIDLLFTDHILPNGLNGRELGKQAQTMRPGIRILLCSGYGSRARNEPFPVLAKPYRRMELATAIRGVLDGTVIA
jgi:CheY-like chemotaxis protein